MREKRKKVNKPGGLNQKTRDLHAVTAREIAEQFSCLPVLIQISLVADLRTRVADKLLSCVEKGEL